MISEILALDSKSHSKQIEDMMHAMVKLGQFADVTLVCDDRRVVQAHRIVLSTFSPVLKDIINSLSGPISVAYLRGIKSTELQPILEFIYLGKTNIERNKVDEFFEVARSLQINFASESETETDKSSGHSTEIETEIKIEEEWFENSDTRTNNLDKIINKSDRFSTANENVDKEDEPINVNEQKKIIPEAAANDIEKFTKENQNSLLSNQTQHKRKYKGGDFECMECPFATSTEVYLKNHMTNVHAGIKYQCNHCRKEFSQKSTLKYHIDAKHKGNKIPCSHCGKKFARNHLSNLKSHIEKKHSGKVYTCDRCGFNADTEFKLKRHNLSFHDENYDYTIVNSE